MENPAKKIQHEEHLYSADILDAMRIRQEIDNEIAGLYEDRSLHDCANFILNYLTDTTTLLDCGSGPGKLAVAFAKKIPAGHVIGIDANEKHIEISKTLAKNENVNNISFQLGDLYQLPFPDHSFDIAFTHTVLCNLDNPVAALKEMKRVVKPGGIIAAREPDYFSSIIYPEYPAIFQGLAALSRVQTGYSDSTIGRKLRKYFNEAGLTDNKVSASCDYYTNVKQLKKIAHYLQSQLIAPDVMESILEKKYATKAEIQEFCHAMDNLALNPDAIYTYSLIEVVGFK